MSVLNQHVAAPKLYNAPAHGSRRGAAVVPQERPLASEDLPIERHRSPEDQARAKLLLPRSYTHQVGAAPGPVPGRAPVVSRARSGPTTFRLRAITGRLLRRGQTN